MQLLNIFHSGLFWPLTAVAVVLLGIFWVQAYRGHNSEWIRIDQQTGKQIHLADKTPYHTMPFFWLGWAIIVLWVIVIFFIVAPDYKGV